MGTHKKMLMLLAAVCALSVSAAAKTPAEIYNAVAAIDDWSERSAYYLALETEEWRAMAEDYLAVAATNLVAAEKLCPNRVSAFIADRNYPAANALAAEYDGRFAAFGVDLNFGRYATMPAMFEANLGGRWALWATNHPVRVALIRKYSDSDAWEGKLTIGERLNALVEEVAATGPYFGHFGHNFTDRKNRILKDAPKAIKRRIRLDGGTFVVGPDGVNPVQTALDALSAALNAPKLAGVKAWAAVWDPSYTWTDIVWNDEYFAALKDDIFYGEKEFSGAARFQLEGWLGVEAYNVFVRQYNGTAAQGE